MNTTPTTPTVPTPDGGEASLIQHPITVNALRTVGEFQYKWNGYGFYLGKGDKPFNVLVAVKVGA